MACNDEFFAEAANLLRVEDPVWKEGEYTERGKWMDGWETRRRREPGHDWCVIALGVPGRVDSVVVDTSHFTGNFPEAFSLEATGVGSDDALVDAEWEELIPHTDLRGDDTATFEVDDRHRVTHLRLNIYPDGGIARLRVTGEPIPGRDLVCGEGGPVDLASSLVGGVAVDASDSHYSPPSNLLRPTEPAGMWDGWETKRRRGPGHDWAEFRLGLPGAVETVVVDTRHFKGNAPGTVSVYLSEDGETWDGRVTMVDVLPDTENRIDLAPPGLGAYLRLDIHPDGGVARVRALGRPDPDAAAQRRLEYLNSLFDSDARRFFHTACASGRWVTAMTAALPYPDPETVIARAERVFDELETPDWLEAFAGHPRIGEPGDETANREQSGVSTASSSVISALAEANRAYEKRHGFTYIVYATGKSAEEMLDLAGARLGNETDQEILIAAEQQKSITETRLRRMMCLGEPS